jgi:regulation of enolase protein 1 (concanavalin A-like superfamily)
MGAAMTRRKTTCALYSVLVLACATDTFAQSVTSAVTPGDLRSYSTISSIGLEWTVLDDTNNDAAVTVDYRRRGTSEWTRALPLVRVNDGVATILAGSVLFLPPDTEFEVRAVLSDPDGGGETRIVTVRTRRVPVAPSGGRVFHVVPGGGGGDGSLGAPFAGIAAAAAVSQPGDTFLLHRGYYGGRIRFDRAGTTTAYIAWTAAGDGEVLIDGIDVAASHLWFGGLTFRRRGYALLSVNSPTNVVVTRCQFLDNQYGIFLHGAGTNWYIVDNDIVGDSPPESESWEGEGIELNTTSGHTVAYNRITHVADGISSPYVNVDIFGNDIFDASDDGIEADTGGPNVRMWENRIHNAVHSSISFQPQAGGPWYIVRNQIVNSMEGPFKFRTTNRFVLLHNTIVNWGDAWPGTSMMCCNEGHLLRAIARNNLWISILGGQIWGFDADLRDWRTDLDYDGFDWGDASNPFEYAGVMHPDLQSFSTASGLEPHGIRVTRQDDWHVGDRHTCFEQFNVPARPPATVPPQVMSLAVDCEAVDAGAPLPNINEGFSGAGPDLGAHERGHAPTVYGPRGRTETAPAPPSSLRATVSTTRVDLLWTDNSHNEAAFVIERSSGGQPFAAIARVSADSPMFSDTGVARDTDYMYRVAAYNEAGLSAYSNTISTAVQETLPAGWQSRDIGAVGPAGSARESEGTFTVKGSGADVWGTADAFHYAYRTLSGNGTIVARVASIDGAAAWTKMGVMIRATTAPHSQHAFMLVSIGKGLAFQRRTVAGGISTSTSGGASTAPRWVRLQRSGNQISASVSANGTSWTVVASETIVMPQDVLAGLAASSHTSSALAAATFDNVSVTQPSSPLPAGWQSRDIGAVGAAGSATESGGTFTVEGAGADVWGTTDAFHYAYRTLAGDGTIVARVASMNGTQAWTKAGVMIRATTAANSQHAFMLVSLRRGLAFQRRTVTGGLSTGTSGGAGTAPQWVRLQRTGNLITASVSSDGSSWTSVGHDTFSMPVDVLVGPVTHSHTTTALATARFDNVTVMTAP